MAAIRRGFLLAAALVCGSAWAGNLGGTAEVTGSGSDYRVVLTNTSPVHWEDVLIIINSSLVCKTPFVLAEGRDAIPLSRCDGAQPTGLIESIKVQAQQGELQVDGSGAGTTARADGSTSGGAPVGSGGVGSGAMKGGYRVSGLGPVRAVKIRNSSNFAWTHCTVTLNGQYHNKMSRIAAHDDDSEPLHQFKRNGEMITSNRPIRSVSVKCKQGSTTLSKF
jgi:hypothetical protein